MKTILIKAFFLCFLLVSHSLSVNADNRFSIPAVTFEAGVVQTLNINLTNTGDVTAFQLNIKLPDGFAIVKTLNEDNEEVEDIALTGRKKSSHSLSFRKKENGSYTMMAFSTSNAIFSGNEGTLVTLKVKASSTMLPGTYQVEMSDMVITASDETTTRPAAFSSPVQVNNVSGGSGAAQLSLSSASLSAGVKSTLSLNLANTLPVTALQFNIRLPEGITMASMLNEDDEEVPAITLTSRKKSSHSLSCNRLGDGSYTVVVISMKNQEFAGEDGALVDFSVAVSSTLPAGNYGITIGNIYICPLVNGQQGITISQPEFTTQIAVKNESGNTDSAQLSLLAGSLKAGTDNTISLDLTNGIEVTALQFNVKLPEGITLRTIKNEDDEDVPAITLTSRKKSSHSLSCNRQGDGSYTVVIISTKNQAFNGTNGALVDFGISVASTLTTGTYELSLKDIYICPLVNGQQGITIKQENFTDRVYVENTGGGGGTGSMGLSVPAISLAVGTEGICNIDMTNDREICAFQFDIKLPEGISIVEEYNEDQEWAASIKLTERKKSSHQLEFQKKENGSYRIIAFSLQNAAFKGNEGAVVAIKVKVDQAMKPGDYGAILSNAMLVTPSEEKIALEDESYTFTITKDTGLENDNSECIWCSQHDGGFLVNGLHNNDIVEVFSVSGQKIFSRKTDGESFWIDGWNLPYNIIVRIIRDSKVVYTNKIMTVIK